MEGYSSRQADPNANYAPRDTYGSSSQRTDVQRGSFGRDQYSDDTRRGYSDQYWSTGSKRDSSSKDGPWYRDQGVVDPKRSRYSDYPSNYQSSESQYKSSERKSSEQTDPYWKASGREYSSESSMGGSKPSMYEPSSSSQYAAPRGDSSSRYGSAEQRDSERRFSSLDQNRDGDQRYFLLEFSLSFYG